MCVLSADRGAPAWKRRDLTYARSGAFSRQNGSEAVREGVLAALSGHRLRKNDPHTLIIAPIVVVLISIDHICIRLQTCTIQVVTIKTL